MIPSWLPLVSAIGICGLLVWGAVTDYKTRTIPNVIPIGIAVLGIGSGTTIIMKVLSAATICLALYLAYRITKKRSGGGDVKLYIALAFAYGLAPLAVMLLFTLLFRGIVILVGKLRKREDGVKIGARFPMCTYIAPAYLAFWGVAITATQIITQ